MLLDSAIMHLEADLRWIEMCEARLPDLKQYTPPTARTETTRDGLAGRPKQDHADPFYGLEQSQNCHAVRTRTGSFVLPVHPVNESEGITMQ